MTLTQVLDKVEHLEKEIEAMKWAFASLSASRQKHSAVKVSAGILGKNFPSGIIYENRIRKEWNRHFRPPIQ